MDVVLTKTDIITAYKKSGIKPRRDCYLTKDEADYCGCAMTAIYLADNDLSAKNFAQESDRINPINEYINSVYGRGSCTDFLEGFDGRGKTSNDIQRVVREASIELCGV